QQLAAAVQVEEEVVGAEVALRRDVRLLLLVAHGRRRLPPERHRRSPRHGRNRRVTRPSRLASRWLLAAALAVSAAVGPAGCAGGPSATQPNDALRAYARALDERRIDDAYRMLSEEARRGLSLEAFRRAVVENPAEAQEIARALARPSGEARVT